MDHITPFGMNTPYQNHVMLPATPARQDTPNPMSQLAALWRAQRYPRGLLLHGEALQEAERWSQEHAGQLNEDEQDFLAECRDAQAYEASQQVLGSYIRCLTVLGLLVAALAWHFFVQANKAKGQVETALGHVEEALDAEQIARVTVEARMAMLEQTQGRADLRAQQARQAMTMAKQEAAASRSCALSAQAHLVAGQDPTLAALLALEALRAADLVVESRQPAAQAAAALYHALGHANPDMDPSLLTPLGAMPVCLSANGKALAATERGVEIYDALTGRRLHILSACDHAGGTATWSPAGDRIMAVDRQWQATIWEAASDQSYRVLARFGGVTSHTRWSPDGALIAGLNPEGDLVVWNTATGDELWRWQPSSSDVIPPFLWSEAGRTIGIMSESRGITILDARSGAVLNQIDTFHPEQEPDLSAIGQLLPWADGEPLLYVLPDDALAHIACCQLARNLSPEEWTRYMGLDTPYCCTCANLPPG